MNTTIIDTVRKRLTESIDAKVLATSAHFFKEGEQPTVRWGYVTMQFAQVNFFVPEVC